MDDGGQRLLDVIEDTHVLETFLRENFPNSGLEDSTRFDNVSSSTESGLVTSGGLDSFVFDGQLVDPLRGGAQPHSSHHSHPVSPHVLQQVLHQPASTLSGPPPHQLHPHQLHHQHQQHHLPQSSLLQQHHASQAHHSTHPQQQHTPSHATLASPVGSNLDVDCIGRSREPCGAAAASAARNDSDHTLQQLLASAPPLGASQPILQLHHQPHQHPLHQSHPQLQSLSSQTHQHVAQQQHPSHHNAPAAAAALPPSIQSSIPNTSALLQHQQHHSQQQAQQQQHRQQAQSRPSQAPRPQPSPVPPKPQHQQQTQTHDPPQAPSDINGGGGLLPIGLPLTPTSVSCGTGNLTPAQQSSPTPAPPLSVSLQDVSRNKGPVVVASSAAKVIVSGAVSSASRVQVVGGATSNQVLGSTTQLLAPSSQLLPGTPIVQPGGQTQVISGGSILAPGTQVLPASNLLPSGQVLSSMPNGQVFPGGQLLPNPQVLTNHLIGNSHVISTVGGISAPSAAPLYVTPTPLPSQIQQPPQTPIAHNSLGAVPHPSVVTSTMTILASPPATVSPAFTVPSKSPVSALPRTSPGPSYPATPSPHHNATPSPASYPNRSPAPSPHSHVSSLRSPVPPPSPAVTPTAITCTSQSTQTVISSSGAQPPVATTLVSNVVGNMGMVQGLVPHLPITQVGASNGVMLAQGTTTPSIKQVVPGGPLIQIVSSQNNPRQPVTIPHPKPIQPKQPQLLPKPPPQGTVRQPTPPPPGKALIGSRPAPPNSHQPIMLGTGGQQPTVITGQHGIGGIVLNPSLLQTGLQQPILIPQPNGVQLLVRPTGHPSGAAGQTLLVPMPNQSQAVTSVGKVPQPQTLVIPGSGQAPALVLNHGMAIGGTNMLSTTQGARAPQPIIRLVAPQTSLQLQQINTPSGPMLLAVPVGQTALNLPGVFAAPSSSVRTLAPQVAPGTLQIGSSLAPVSLNPLQLSGGGLQQVSSSSQPLQLSASLPSSLSSVITTTTPARSSADEGISLASTPPAAQISLQAPPPAQQPPPSAAQPPSQHLTAADMNKNKKKSKKKKKEKESKEEKGKGKAVSINLNELLKETGIFDENEFGGLGIVEDPPDIAAPQGLPQTAAAPPPTINCKVSTGSSHLVLSTPLSQPIPTMSVNQNNVAATPLTLATTSTSNSLGPSPVAPINTSMCFTFDVHGKLVLGSGDATKPHITAIAGSLPPQGVHGTSLQMVSPSGMNLNSGGTYVIGSNEGISVPVTRNPAVPPVGHLVALHPTSGSQIGEVTHPQNFMKIDNLHPQLITSKGSNSSTQNEILKVAQNTQLIHSQSEKAVATSLPSSASSTTGTSSLITSLLNNHPVPPVIGVSTGNSDSSSTISVHLTGNDKFNIVSADGKPLATDFSSNGLIGTHPSSQVSVNNSAVIVSSNYANSFLPGALISGKAAAVAAGVNSQQNSDAGTTTLTTTTATATAQAHFVTCNTLNKGINTTIPVSMHVVDTTNKGAGAPPPPFPSQYLTTGVKTNIVETTAARVRKSGKKKKKDKEVETITCPVSFISSGGYQLTQEKSSTTSTSHNVVSTQTMTLSSPVLMSNGNISASSASSLPSGATLPVGTGNCLSKSEPSAETHSTRVEVGGVLISASQHSQASQHQQPVQVFSHVISSSNASTTTTSCAPSPSSLVPSSSSGFIGNCLNNSITNVITVTSNSIVSTLSNSHSSTNVTTVSGLTNTPTVTRMSIPIGPPTHTSLNPAPGFVVQPGQQVKQLLLSPHNQEALKKVHSQIQDLQNKKGPLGEQDKSLQQKLIVEYRKIMATGTPVPVSHSSLTQPLHSINTSQHNPIKYSHSVGHKKIVFTPNPKKVFSQSHPQIKKHCSAETASKLTAVDTKSKEFDTVVSSACPVSTSSSAIAFSSQPVTISDAGYVTGLAVSTGATTLVGHSSSSSAPNVTYSGFSAIQQLVVSPGRNPLRTHQVSDGSKVPEKETLRSNNITAAVSGDPSLISSSSSRGYSNPAVASMPVIITSTKPSSLPATTTGASSVFSHRIGNSTGSMALSRSTTSSIVSSGQLPLVNVHPQDSSQSQLPPPSSVGEMLPPPQTTTIVTPVSSLSQPSSISFPPPHPQHQGTQPPPTSTLPTMRSSFSIPLTRDQLFEHQLKTDQNGALNPDYKTPFKNKIDACKRLIRYHVYNDLGPSPSELFEGDNQFEIQCESLIKKFTAMQYKYKSLLLRESTRRHPSSETAMLYRLFIQEEKNHLEREKMDVVSGKDLNLPPAPSHWIGAAPPPIESPFPWEDDWENDKVYLVTHGEEEEEDEGDQKATGDSDKIDSTDEGATKGELASCPPYLGSQEEEDEWPHAEEEDLDEEEEEEGQDEGRLQILMEEEETDESRSQGACETLKEDDEEDGKGFLPPSNTQERKSSASPLPPLSTHSQSLDTTRLFPHPPMKHNSNEKPITPSSLHLFSSVSRCGCSEGEGLDERTSNTQNSPKCARNLKEECQDRETHHDLSNKYNISKLCREAWSGSNSSRTKSRGSGKCDFFTSSTSSNVITTTASMATSVVSSSSKAGTLPPYGANNSFIIKSGHESTKENGVDAGGGRGLRKGTSRRSLSPDEISPISTRPTCMDGALHPLQQERQAKFHPTTYPHPVSKAKDQLDRTCSSNSALTGIANPPSNSSNYCYYYDKQREVNASTGRTSGGDCADSMEDCGTCNNRVDEKYNRHHDRKYKMDRDRRKHEKKTREERSSHKLKIRLRPGDPPKGVVPPLRIRSDERGVGSYGGLKLTLKKQEGSSGYYRVGEEKQRPPGREYRVELSEEEDEEEEESNGSFVPPAGKRGNSDLSPSPEPGGGRQLKGFSVVLENCLEGEAKVYSTKVFAEEDSRGTAGGGGGYKRSKRLKSHHQKDVFGDSLMEKRENSITHNHSATTWSSKFVERCSSKQENHHNSVLFSHHHQTHQHYALDAGGLPTPPQTPHHQSICVSPQGQKLSQQSSRNSQRFS